MKEMGVPVDIPFKQWESSRILIKYPSWAWWSSGDPDSWHWMILPALGLWWRCGLEWRGSGLQRPHLEQMLPIRGGDCPNHDGKSTGKWWEMMGKQTQIPWSTVSMFISFISHNLSQFMCLHFFGGGIELLPCHTKLYPILRHTQVSRSHFNILRQKWKIPCPWTLSMFVHPGLNDPTNPTEEIEWSKHISPKIGVAIHNFGDLCSCQHSIWVSSSYG